MLVALLTAAMGLAATTSAGLIPCQAASCPVVFDGRVPATATPQDFDTANGGGWNPFNPNYVKGQSLAWSDIILLPSGLESSLFDAPGANASASPEVTISDLSIFNNQRGFRRAGLQFLADRNAGSPGSEGQKTLHFSLRQDEARPFNLTHEYLIVWHEAGDYSSNQFNFQAGTLIGREDEDQADSWKLLDRNNKLLWSTPIETGVWQNFAITLDFEENLIQAWYSSGLDPLEEALAPVSNDNSGDGQYQFGILKKPTGTDDVVNGGYQQSPVDEGLIYGGVFLEDSADGCVSKAPASGAGRRRL